MLYARAISLSITQYPDGSRDIDLMNKFLLTVPSKRTSNNPNLVEPTQYNIQPNRITRKPPLKPWPLPDFNPFYPLTRQNGSYGYR